MRLENILKGVADIIGARILNLSTQDYDPMGASVVILIAEGSTPNEATGSISLAHLDKSHICAHTYPETDNASGISTFRVDIDISTCGKISPLRSLNYLIKSFDSEVVLLTTACVASLGTSKVRSCSLTTISIQSSNSSRKLSEEALRQGRHQYLAGESLSHEDASQGLRLDNYLFRNHVKKAEPAGTAES